MVDTVEEILHIFVVGFHHKKGCQVEFSYPPLEQLPDAWKTLPSLAMPDGAHNYDRDVVYFHLSSLEAPLRTLFGVSCFQQIPLEKVKNKTADMTRGAVQKAVCVLSTVPLYGYIQVKMELITAAFFDGGDFSQTSILEDAFNHLNTCLPGTINQHLLEGISVKELLLRFRHRSLLLFKLLLLERKVVFFHSPVKPLCSTLLSLLSLHPRLIECGLFESSFISSSNPGSPIMSVTNSARRSMECDSINNSDIVNHVKEQKVRSPSNSIITDDGSKHIGDKTLVSSSADKTEARDNCNQNLIGIPTNLGSEEDECEDALDAMLMEDCFADIDQQNSSNGKVDGNSGCDVSMIKSLDLEACGLPLKLFSKGNLCFPYLSITYLDYLANPGVRGFVAGATNVLFKQKRDISDAVIEIETPKIEIQCPDLRKQLSLTTEDLRFMDQLYRGILDPRDITIPGIGREGDENWIRAHFEIYIVSLLRTSLLTDGSKELDHFNQHFIAAWKNTHNYRMWLALEHDGILEMNPGHPGAGSLSVQDVRLRFSQAMMSSESGRKLNQAVATTGKAVGGAITQAKGAFFGWLNNFTTQDGKQPPRPIDNI